MKQKLGALCLAAALLVLSGCGGSSLSIESRQWELSAVLDGETGAVVACGPSWQEAYPDAAVVSLSCQAQGGQPRPTGAGENLHRHLPAGRALPKGHGVPSHCGGQRQGRLCAPPRTTAPGSRLPPWCSPSRRHTLCISPANKSNDKSPGRVSPPGPFSLGCDQACKPGSVVDSHLSWPDVAIRLTPPPRDAPGRAVCPSTVLLRIGFTGPRSLPRAGELLPRLSTLTGKSRRYLSVALSLGSPPAAVSRYPCPVEARTFLRRGVSPIARDCPACSHALYCSGPKGFLSSGPFRKQAVLFVPQLLGQVHVVVVGVLKAGDLLPQRLHLGRAVGT